MRTCIAGPTTPNSLEEQLIMLETDLSSDQLLEMYRKMWLIRHFEQEMARLFQKNLIHGSVHSYVGQEAIAVGGCSALDQQDVITSTHRGHGHCLAKGGDPEKMMAELFGKATGYCKGKGGSMHIAELDIGILGANAIVGGSVGIATGAAFTSKYRKEGRVALCFFGDGALHQGLLHECANMAALWKLPVVYVCEYNAFAEFTHSDATFPIKELTLRSAAYGFPGVRVDGNDVWAVYRAARDAVVRARQGLGPTLLVAYTYRIEGHFVGDPLTYRTKEEVEHWRKLDPILGFRAVLEREGIPSESLQEIESKAEQAIQRAVDFAMSSPEPDFAEIMSDVYVEEGAH
jgi:TPP-dependent pyruvate/acetoin dehydrogenase alpha subunit